MPKARAHPNQLGFGFGPPVAATGPAALAGLEQRICRSVGTMLASDGRHRELIAADMSLLLDDEVSRSMLDAYSSPGRHDHKVPMSRYFGLVAVTARLDLFDPIVREIGGALLSGQEVLTARLGHIDQQIAKLQAERKQVASIAPLIRSGER